MGTKVALLVLIVGFVTASAVAHAEYDVDNYTLALYHFNEGYGTNVYDSVGGLHNLTLTSDTAWIQDGYSESGINTFMSQYAYQSGTFLDSFPDDGSVSMWIRPNNTINPATDVTIQTIFSKGNKWSNPYANLIDVQWCGTLCGTSDGRLIYELYKDGAQYKVYSTTTNWTANTWYKVTFTWGRLGMQLYVNNILEGTSPFTGKPSDGTDRDMGIGYNLRVGGYYFNGSIDEIRISNVQRTILLELDTIDNKEINVNETLVIDLNSTYDGFGTLTYYTNADDVLPGAFDFDSATGVFEWTPGYQDAGIYNVMFGVTDGQYSDEQTVAITVDGPPALNPIGDKQTNEAQALFINLSAINPENDVLTYYTNAATILNSQFYFNQNTGAFAWTPTYYDAGVYTVMFNVTDGGFWDSETITITVNNVPYTDLDINNNDIMLSDDHPLKYTPVTITAIFRNILEIDPDSVLVRFYLDSPNGTLLGEHRVDTDGRSTFAAQIEWIPQTEGNHNVYVWVDPTNEVDEALETNNIAYSAIQILTKPDIKMANNDILFSNNHPTHNDRIVVMAMVHNIESMPTGTFAVRAYDGQWPNLIGETQLSLNGHNTELVMFNWTASAGNHTIHVYADSTFVVDELNEGNNHGQKAIYVNRAPYLSALYNRSINEGQQLLIDADAMDMDGDTLTYYTNAADVIQSAFSFDQNNGAFAWTPTYYDAGTYSVTFNVTDGYAWDSENVVIHVNNAPSGPKTPLPVEQYDGDML